VGIEIPTYERVGRSTSIGDEPDVTVFGADGATFASSANDDDYAKETSNYNHRDFDPSAEDYTPDHRHRGSPGPGRHGSPARHGSPGPGRLSRSLNYEEPDAIDECCQCSIWRCFRCFPLNLCCWFRARTCKAAFLQLVALSAIMITGYYIILLLVPDETLRNTISFFSAHLPQLNISIGGGGGLGQNPGLSAGLSLEPTSGALAPMSAEIRSLDSRANLGNSAANSEVSGLKQLVSALQAQIRDLSNLNFTSEKTTRTAVC
jgi:hypothetical protein